MSESGQVMSLSENKSDEFRKFVSFQHALFARAWGTQPQARPWSAHAQCAGRYGQAFVLAPAMPDSSASMTCSAPVSL